jgi:cyclase
VNDIIDALTQGAASAALAASIFHFGDVRIAEAKRALARVGVEVRPPQETTA